MKFYIIEYDHGEGNGLETSEVVSGENERQAFEKWLEEYDFTPFDFTAARAYPIEDGIDVLSGEKERRT